jgi:hypothetical protein
LQKCFQINKKAGCVRALFAGRIGADCRESGPGNESSEQFFNLNEKAVKVGTSKPLPPQLSLLLSCRTLRKGSAAEQ